MKITPLRTRSLLAASCLAFTPLAFAQSPVPTAGPSGLSTPPVPVAASPSRKKLPVFSSPAGSLNKVVDILQAELEGQNLERLNVLIPGESESAKVPALDLRNVSGSEALSLIASAASCQLEPIYGPGGGDDQTQRIIGYKFRFMPSSNRGSGAKWTLGSSDNRALPTPKSSELDAPTSSAAGPKSSDPFLASPSLTPAAGGLGSRGSIAFFGGEGGGGGMGLASSPPAIETHVYPLAAINASKAFGEVMKTLEEVIATSGVPKDQVKLALHEKTNVLVVRGPAEAQMIVGQFLSALEKNKAEATQEQNSGARRDAVTLEVRMEAMSKEMDRLRKQLDESEAQRRELEKQFQRQQDQIPKKGDRQ